MATIKLYDNTGFGEQISFIPALKALKKNHHDVVSESPLFNKLTPYLLSEYKTILYNYGIVLNNQDIKTAHKAKSECKKVIGFPYNIKLFGNRKIPILSSMFYSKNLKYNPNKHKIVNYMNLISLLTTKKTKIEYRLDNIETTPKQDLIGIAPDSGNKNYKPWLNWPKLINELPDNKSIILFGQDRIFINQIKSRIKEKKVITVNSQDIDRIIEALKNCEIVISADNFYLNLSDILKIPLLALFGMTSIKENAPISKSSEIFSLNLKCSPCYRNEKVNCIYGMNNKCMNFPIKAILDKLKEIN